MKIQLPKTSIYQTQKWSLTLLFLFSFLGLFSQVVNYTFTSAGAIGRFGPSQAQINAAYLSTNLNNSVTSNSGIQQFTIQVAGNYRIEARGAQGASSGAANGGLGARMAGDFYLTAGTVLKIVVGQQGIGSSSGAGGGGGGSYVATITNSPLVVAGGGSGSGDTSYPGTSAGTASVGNAGGTCASAGPTGFGGGDASGCGSGAGGAGGFYGNGSSGGSWGGQFGYGFVQGSNGGLSGSGGRDGGFGGGAGTHYFNTGGGAGGGYTGGGAPYHGAQYVGGAGSSYNAGTNQTNTANFNSGDGLVIITRLCNINLYVSGASPGNAICAASSATITTDAISSYTWSTGSNASSIVVTPGSTTVYSLTAMSPSNCITTAVTTIIVNGSAPVLTVSASSNSVCLGNTVSILATGALTYTWSGGITNGVPFTPSVSNTYLLLGQNGCGISTASVAIAIAPLPVVGVASSTLVCAGSTSTLNASGATTYTWYPVNYVGASVLVSPQANTIYTVVGASGNCLGTNTVAISANPVPTIQVAASNSIICGGESSTLTASGALGYTWQPGNLTGPSIVVSPLVPTSYYVTGNNSFGCTVTVQQGIVAFASPTIVVNPFTTTICAGGTAILNASGANTYTWNTGPTTSSISVNPSSTTVYTVSGTNTITQCGSSNTVEVSVFTPSMSVSNPTAVCVGSSATLTASGANTYQWNTGGFGPNLVVTPNSTTSYTVTGITNSGNVSCSTTAMTTVSVNPLPVIAAVASRSNICKNESTVLTATGGVSYLWSNSGSTASISVSPTINTTYTVTGTDANGCNNSGTIFIRVYGCVGLTEQGVAKLDVLIYPNPNNGTFKIESSEPMDLILVNNLGQLVKDLQLNAGNNYSLEIKNLASGIYFITTSDPALGFSKKIIVQD